jgi:DNA-3-methyladenine glycosylase II
MARQRVPDTHSLLLNDPVLAALVAKHGPPQLAVRIGEPFQALLRSIIYQQLSGKAAATIHQRFLDLFGTTPLAPAGVLALSDHSLRSAGLSGAKVAYVKDVARAFSDGTIDAARLPSMRNEEIVEHLLRVKGIGEWTAHMFLIFTLGRPDVLPTGDLAIRKGFQRVYKLKDLPTRKEMEQLSAPWRPHASAAAWYLWREMDESNPNQGQW